MSEISRNGFFIPVSGARGVRKRRVAELMVHMWNGEIIVTGRQSKKHSDTVTLRWHKSQERRGGYMWKERYRRRIGNASFISCTHTILFRWVNFEFTGCLHLLLTTSRMYGTQWIRS